MGCINLQSGLEESRPQCTFFYRSVYFSRDHWLVAVVLLHLILQKFKNNLTKVYIDIFFCY